MFTAFRSHPSPFCLFLGIFFQTCFLFLFLPPGSGNSPAFGAELVRVGVYQNEPLVLIDDQGHKQGLAIDVLQAIAEEEGWQLTFVEGTWAEGLQRLTEGRIDLLAVVAYTEERSGKFQFNSEPLLVNWGRLYNRNGSEPKSIFDLDGKMVALLENDIHAEAFLEMASGFGVQITPLFLKDYFDVLQAVEQGPADSGVVNRFFGMRRAAQFEVTATPLVFNPVKVHFASPSVENRPLLTAIDRHLEQFKADQGSVYYRSFDKWLGIPETGQRLPDWAKVGGALLIAAFIIAIAFIITLRGQVRSRTNRLKNEVDQCQLMRDFLSQRESLFRELFNHMSNGVAVYQAVDDGRNFIFKDINPAGAQIGRSQREDLLGKSVREVFPGADALGLIPALQRVYRSGQPEELPVACYEDERMQLYLENYLCKLPSGELVAVFEDVTGRKQQEERLKQSLLRYEQLFTAHRSPVLLIDPNNAKLVDTNPAACEFYGYRRAELLAMRIIDIDQLPTVDVFSRMQQAVAEDQHDFRSRHRLKNGDTRDVDVVTSNIQLDGRALLCLIVHDITERLKIEGRLIHTSDEWNSTFDAIPDVIIILDTNCNLIRVNRAATEFAGKGFREMVGKPCHEMFPENQDACSLCPTRKVLKTGRVHTEEMEYLYRGKIFRKTCAPIFDNEGNIDKLVVVGQDISEQRHLEEQLFQAQKMEAIGTLAGGVAHDFNNILSAIIGFSEIAKLELPDDSRAIEDIDEVLQASRRAADLIKQILTFSRKDSAARDAFQPHLVIKESLKMLRSSMPSTVNIEENIDPESGFIEASATRLQQLFMNLCTNAIHALHNEKGTLKVGLQREECCAGDISEPDIQPGPFVVLTVADNGSGMPPEIVERIFEPYFTTKTVDRGTGLGLAVVHGIVAISGGFIRLDSRPGEGSTFRVYLPAAEPPDRETTLPADTEMPPGGHEHILVVDDEAAILEINRSMLQNLGYRVTIAHDAAQALAMLEGTPDNFDLIITDQTMPEMTGSELTQKVLSLRPGLPVILCTGYSSQVSEKEALELGIHSFLMKPVDFKTLARTVRTALDL